VSDVSLADAVTWVAQGGVLAYPTETVWGLGADARSRDAVERLRAFKGRGDDAPISILVTGVGALSALGFSVGAAAQRLARDFWPGPLTLVLPCAGAFAPGVARGDGAIGVRCSPHAVAAELAQRCEDAGTGPLTATSCNRTGAPPAHTRADARSVCSGDPRARVLAGGADAEGAPASTVIDMTGDAPRVLRWGALSEPALRPVLEELAA
jgi:tRNA threonylcarbamoyl adenosine modification protein (Sua5/YciO/YrdC/YwlC family)